MKLSQKTLPGMTECIFSPGLLDGNSPLILRNGEIGQFGQDRHLASHIPSPVSEKPSPTNATCGQKCSDSCETESLSSRLANRLRARLDSVGSMEYATTWKQKATKSGRQYWEHSASARRTSDRDCIGWPTAAASDGTRGGVKTDNMSGTSLTQIAAAAPWPSPMSGDHTGGKIPPSLLNRKNITKLKQAVAIVPWSTPQANDSEKRGCPSLISGQQKCLPVQAQLSSWGTPRVTTNNGIPSPLCTGNGSRLEDQASTAIGAIPESSIAQTASLGVLDAAFSRWLQGFPEQWDQASPNFQSWCDVQDQIASADSVGMATPSVCP